LAVCIKLAALQKTASGGCAIGLRRKRIPRFSYGSFKLLSNAGNFFHEDVGSAA